MLPAVNENHETCFGKSIIHSYAYFRTQNRIMEDGTPGVCVISLLAVDQENCTAKICQMQLSQRDFASQNR